MKIALVIVPIFLSLLSISVLGSEAHEPEHFEGEDLELLEEIEEVEPKSASSSTQKGNSHTGSGIATGIVASAILVATIIVLIRFSKNQFNSQDIVNSSIQQQQTSSLMHGRQSIADLEVDGASPNFVRWKQEYNLSRSLEREMFQKWKTNIEADKTLNAPGKGQLAIFAPESLASDSSL